MNQSTDSFGFVFVVVVVVFFFKEDIEFANWTAGKRWMDGRQLLSELLTG